MRSLYRFVVFVALVQLGVSSPLDAAELAKDQRQAKDRASKAPSESEMRIRTALAAPVDFDFKGVPLKEVLQTIRDRCKIEVRLDLPAAMDVGVGSNFPVTRSLRGISLRSALRLILDDCELAFCIHDEVLYISSPSKIEDQEFLQTKIYRVGDLILEPEVSKAQISDFEPLCDVLNETIGARTWESQGGQGNIAMFPNSKAIVVTQSEKMHEEISRLLGSLRRARATARRKDENLKAPRSKASTLQPTAIGLARNGGDAKKATTEPSKSRGNAASVATDLPAENERRIRTALAAPVDFEFKNAPIKDVAASIKERFKIEVQVDLSHHFESTTGTLVTCSIHGASLRSALGLILDDLQLGFCIRNEVLFITSTADRADREIFLETRVYSVADVIRPAQGDETSDPDFQSLIEAIQNSVLPMNWSARGGLGTIKEFPHSLAIVVTQTDDAHQRIEKLLSGLRKARNAEAATKKKQADLQ